MSYNAYVGPQVYNQFSENLNNMCDKKLLGDMKNLINIAAAAAVATGDTQTAMMMQKLNDFKVPQINSIVSFSSVTQSIENEDQPGQKNQIINSDRNYTQLNKEFQ